MRYGLPDNVVNKIEKVLTAQKEIEKAVIYGSRGRGDNHEGSDIDLALFGPELSFDHQLKISGEIDELMLPWKTDIVIFHRIKNKKLADDIYKGGQILFQR